MKFKHLRYEERTAYNKSGWSSSTELYGGWRLREIRRTSFEQSLDDTIVVIVYTYKHGQWSGGLWGAMVPLVSLGYAAGNT